MRNVRFLPIAVLTVLAVSAFAQSTTPPPPPPAPSSADTGKHNMLPSVFGGIGVLFMNGNVGTGTGVAAYSTIRGGYTLGIEERPVSFLGVELDGIIGKLAASERSEDTNDNLNYQTNVIQFDLRANLHLDGLILKPNATIAPFLFAGFSYQMYHVYTDLYNAQGDKYFYWTDGSISTRPQSAANVATANSGNNYWITTRSYNYSTSVASGSTECVPVGLGVKFKITDNLALNAQAAYYFTFSDGMEISTIGSPSKAAKFLFTFATIEWHFTKASESHLDETRYQNITMDNSFIQDTMKKNDGISAAQLAKLDSADRNRDTNAVSRSEAFNEHPTEGVLQQQDQEEIKKKHDPNKVPPRFRPADKNHDGYISSQEITEAIDEFFDGTSQMTIADINGLIDYFFDQ